MSVVWQRAVSLSRSHLVSRWSQLFVRARTCSGSGSYYATLFVLATFPGPAEAFQINSIWTGPQLCENILAKAGGARHATVWPVNSRGVSGTQPSAQSHSCQQLLAFRTSDKKVRTSAMRVNATRPRTSKKVHPWKCTAACVLHNLVLYAKEMGSTCTQILVLFHTSVLYFHVYLSDNLLFLTFKHKCLFLRFRNCDCYSWNLQSLVMTM